MCLEGVTEISLMVIWGQGACYHSMYPVGDGQDFSLFFHGLHVSHVYPRVPECVSCVYPKNKKFVSHTVVDTLYLQVWVMPYAHYLALWRIAGGVVDCIKLWFRHQVGVRVERGGGVQTGLRLCLVGLGVECHPPSAPEPCLCSTFLPPSSSVCHRPHSPQTGVGTAVLSAP